MATVAKNLGKKQALALPKKSFEILDENDNRHFCIVFMVEMREEKMGQGIEKERNGKKAKNE